MWAKALVNNAHRKPAPYLARRALYREQVKQLAYRYSMPRLFDPGASKRRTERGLIRERQKGLCAYFQFAFLVVLDNVADADFYLLSTYKPSMTVLDSIHGMIVTHLTGMYKDAGDDAWDAEGFKTLVPRKMDYWEKIEIAGGDRIAGSGNQARKRNVSYMRVGSSNYIEMTRTEHTSVSYHP